MEKWFVFRNITKYFRFIEILFALLFFPWLYSKLPFITTFFAIFIGHLTAFITNPIFIFTLFNSILISLYIKSSPFSDNKEADLYEEITFYSTEDFLLPSLEPQEILYQDKEMIDVVSEVKEEASEIAAWPKEMEKSLKVVARVEEELSNEEFKRTIENFIAKQMKFHKEEKMAIVACS